MKIPPSWLLAQLKAHITDLSFWMRWLGLTVEQRKAFWRAMEARER